MGNAMETFIALGEITEEHTSEEGIDFVAVLATVVEGLKASGAMTIEQWELVKMGMDNSVRVMNHLIDEEIAQLKTIESEVRRLENIRFETKRLKKIEVARSLKDEGFFNFEIAKVMGIPENEVRLLLERE